MSGSQAGKGPSFLPTRDSGLWTGDWIKKPPGLATRGSIGVYGLAVLLGAEHVGVTVVHLEGEGVDGGGIDPAAFAAPPVDRLPRAVLAARGAGVLVLHEGVLHVLVPGLPLRAAGAVILEEGEARV